MMNAAVSEEQKNRARLEWSRIAGEDVAIEAHTIGGPVIAYCSELGALRLYLAFRGTGRAAYSENLKTWYFRNK